MTWQRSASQWFRLPAERLWDVLSRPERWAEWNPAVAGAALDGGLREGATGHYSPAHRLLGPLHSRTAPAFTVTAAEPVRRLALRQPQPGGHQDIEWTVEERDGGTLFTQTVSLHGPLAQQFGLTAGEPLVRRFAEQCARLYRLAEAHDGDRPERLTVLAGGSGFLGTLLAADLTCSGHDVAVLARARRSSPFRQILWDGRRPGAWSEELGRAGSLSIVNLCGADLDRPGTPENLELLERSRTVPTLALAAASREWERPVAHWVQQSGVHVYAGLSEPAGETAPVPESTPGLAAVVRAWEASAAGARAERMSIMRTGVVLHRDAPLMSRLATPARLGAGGHLGTGGQWFSWIHAADWVRAARTALGLPPGPGEEPLGVPAGVMNATAPHPVTNREFMARLRDALGVPAGIPAPTPLFRLAAAVLRTNPDLALDSIRAVPESLLSAGFRFEHPYLASALEEMTS
ncbi:DUF1731 domain-containing protein [Sinomonas halotolerans]|uniref:DUF1731 domain-containing protein n=1 Tax=Sinomonas halotolerans TaxID=1644133 RepID=A0ABU9X3K3_9MICC